MTGGLIMFLIIVVWLIVLAPLLLRGQKPIRRVGEGIEETRVVFAAGTQLPPTSYPHLRSSTVITETAPKFNAATPEDYEDYEVVDVLIEDEEPRLFTKRHRVSEVDIVDGDIVHELPAVAEEHEEIEVEIAEGAYEFDSSYVDSADLLHPAGEPTVAEFVSVDAETTETNDATEAVSEASLDSEDAEPELTPADLEFAAKRARRGGWDPQADAKKTLNRYQRRTRTLLAMAGVTIVGLVVAFLVGDWTWWIPAVSTAAIALYLTALRQQVRDEKELRARRIRQLRRARLGVRNQADADLPLPRQFRHPGAVVLDIDDESPDFEHLAIHHPVDEDDVLRAG
ncbi:gephyrin-like molybdotransferase receptor GlpR [Corynebacterium caspium]|uniref:divisome protein SepX/GlpR n=1 Tax=Corynebacterium caspium TaxID=234828 RepID=UPI00039CD8E4|nr:gephyrin-like molybdotransferase receptor GlpR [Corynebacterium caspium]WKD59618.1 hypothetical protein CCASP_06170 [Corynebacterium caspium DSM 44850]